MVDDKDPKDGVNSTDDVPVNEPVTIKPAEVPAPEDGADDDDDSKE